MIDQNAKIGMRYVFFGSPEFAAIILERLIAASMAPALVVCNPDRPVGRKKIVTPPSTKVVAAKHDIPFLQPESLRNFTFPILLSTFDFAIVAAYAQIIPKTVLDLPRLGTIGVHPSLLPKYRGATPIQSVILGGEAETGVTLYMMDEKMDHGPTVESGKWKVESAATYQSLLKELAEMSGQMLIEILPQFIDGKIVPQEQNHAAATFTKKFMTEDGFVDLAKDDPIMIDRKVRALNPDPGVYTFVERKKGSPSTRLAEDGESRRTSSGYIRMKILATKIVEGKLQLLTTQLEGKKPTRA